MFKSALVKLTVVYVLLAMGLSLFFSVVFYHFATRELQEGLRNQYKVLVQNDHDGDNIDNISAMEADQRARYIRSDLAYLNMVVLVGSVVVGYVLARRTLRPIEEAHKSQVRFTAEASHELRTPLTAMKADTESILMQQSISPKELEETLRNNLRDIERLERLSRHLLDMGRYKSDANLAEEAVDMRRLARRVVRQVARQYPDKHIRVTQELDNVAVQADPVALEQLLVILVDNAFKYSNVASSVRTAVRPVGNGIVIEIADKGLGIDQVDLPHIFEHFYRSSRAARAEHASGYGLGLPLAQDIVTSYRGSIAVDSEAGRGTTVIVKLPLRRAASNP